MNRDMKARLEQANEHYEALLRDEQHRATYLLASMIVDETDPGKSIAEADHPVAEPSIGPRHSLPTGPQNAPEVGNERNPLRWARGLKAVACSCPKPSFPFLLLPMPSIACLKGEARFKAYFIGFSSIFKVVPEEGFEPPTKGL